MFVSAALVVVVASASRGDVTVQVVDEKRQPVAGAWVAGFVASGNGFVVKERGSHGIDAIQEWLESGASGAPGGPMEWVACDFEGRARLSVASFWNDVVAVTPTASGHEIFARGMATQDETVTIHVKPNRFWRVPVVDSANLKSRLAVSVEFGTETILRSRDSFERITTRTSAGADNVATLGPVDLLFDPLAIDPTLVARLDLPIDPAPRLRLHASRLDENGTPVPPLPPLTIPPHGSLEIHVVDRDGRIVTRPGFVTVKRNVFARLFSRDWQNADLGSWRKNTNGGIVRFDVVGLGAALVLEDEDGDSFRGIGDPPIPFDQAGAIAPLEVAGDTRVLTLPSPDPARREVVVHGRAVDRDGSVLSQRELAIHLLDPTCSRRMDMNRPRQWSRDVATSARGSFTDRFVLPGDARGKALLVITDVGPLGRREDSPISAKDLEVDSIETWHEKELGDVVLEPLPLLVAGHAVDEHGEPVANLDVHLLCDQGALDHDPSVPPWWLWPRIRIAGTTTRDGRFAVHGFGRELAWRLTASNDEFASEQNLPVTFGSSDIVVRCERGRDRNSNSYYGQIAGALLLDPDVPMHAIVVTILASAAEGDRGIRLSDWDATLPGDRIGGERIPIGTWTVTATFRDFGSPPKLLATIPGVKIEAGRTTTLAPIDLRGRIRVKRVTIQDRAGAHVLAGHIVAREAVDAEGASRPDSSYFFDGESIVCAVDDWPMLDFMANGFRRVTRRFADGPTETIVLPPALLVHVRLPEKLRLPPAPLTLDVEMDTDDVMHGISIMGGSEPPHRDSAIFDASHAVDLELPAAACYELKLYVSHREHGPGFSNWRGAYVQSSQIVTLFDRDGARRVDLDVTQAEIDAAVKMLGY